MGARGAATRDKLVESSLAMFREDGFEATTMRRIADAAGVSLGNAYYYFASKDDLVHELYLVVQREHRALAIPRLRQGAPLAENLALVLHTGLDVMTPYHRFGGAFVQVALPASSRASPFSLESAQARGLAIDLMRQAADASRPRPASALRERMPMLLWLAYLGITLHWVVDSSPDQARTRRLVDGVAPIVGRAVRLSRLPVARGLVDDVVGLLAPASASTPTAAATPAGASR
ncbi:TetR family transcriptional regulator [Lapillicoccus sp.]|uniref:TetR/AcrR family transcriptional regulator n=1 Tax=Lapillicoccus sp. TaxID=1909287 RepID=UPI003266F25B